MSKDAYAFAPDYGIVPGEALVDLLGSLGMSQAELARRSGLSVKHINQVCQGLAPITPETAVLINRATGIDARILLRMESEAQAERGFQAESVRLAEQLDWLSNFPIRELKQRGWVKTQTKSSAQLRELLDFFRVAAPRAWENVWATPTAYRLSQAFTPDMAALASWIRIGELRADEIQLQPYSSDLFRSALPHIRSLTRVEDSAAWLSQLELICANAGVAVVVEREIKGARVNGVVRWLSSGNPLIILSGRHRWADIFWFTFFHEAGHLLIHDRRRLTFVDSPRARSSRSDATANRVIEQEADDFASSLLVPAEYASRLSAIQSADDVSKVALEAEIHPGIIVGRMQHDGLIHYSQLNDLRAKLTFSGE